MKRCVKTMEKTKTMSENVVKNIQEDLQLLNREITIKQTPEESEVKKS